MDVPKPLIFLSGILNNRLYVIIESLKGVFFHFFPDFIDLRFFFLDAKNLWNNLLEPKGAKSFWKRYSSLQCPTSERPFFSTKNNSDDFDQYYDEDSSGHF